MQIYTAYQRETSDALHTLVLGIMVSFSVAVWKYRCRTPDHEERPERQRQRRRGREGERDREISYRRPSAPSLWRGTASWWPGPVYPRQILPNSATQFVKLRENSAALLSPICAATIDKMVGELLVRRLQPRGYFFWRIRLMPLNGRCQACVFFGCTFSASCRFRVIDSRKRRTVRPMSDTQQSWATLLLNFIAQQICLGNCQFSIGKQSYVHSIIY